MIAYYNLLYCIYLDLKLFLSQTLDLLSPMAPLSFEPVAESGYSVFSQYPATLLGEPFVFPLQLRPHFSILVYSSAPTRQQRSSPQRDNSRTSRSPLVPA